MKDNQPDNKNPERDVWMVTVGLIILALGILAMGIQGPKAEKTKIDNIKIKSIYWSDADSGRINGNIKFRLNSIDAPETGGVGAAIGGAKCELERERGFASKEWIVSFTRGKKLKISNEYGLDKYERHVLDLSVAGEDLGQVGVKTGHLKPWPHKGRRALIRKPDWCE